MSIFKFKLRKELKSINSRMKTFTANQNQLTAELNSILKKYPKCSEAFYLLGRNLNAINYINMAIELNNNFCDAYFFRAILRSSDDEVECYNDLVKAKQLLKKSEFLTFIDIKRLYFELAGLEYKYGIPTTAIEYYSKSISFLPIHAPFYIQRGKIYTGIKDYEKALEDFNKAIQLEPANSSVYTLRANVKEKLGDEVGHKEDLTLGSQELFEFEDKEYGKKLFKKNIIRIPSYFDLNKRDLLICPNCKSKRISYYLYGYPRIIKLSKEEKEEVEMGNIILVEYEKDVKSPLFICRNCGTQMVEESLFEIRDSEKSNKFLEKAFEMRAELDHEKSFELFKEALKFDISNVKAINQVLGYYQVKGMIKEAISLLERSIKLCPQELVLFVKLADLYSLVREHKRAILLLSNVISKDPNYGAAYKYLAIEYFKIGQVQMAIDIYRIALKRFPNEELLWYGLAELYLDAHMFYEASEAFEKVVELVDGSSHAKAAKYYLQKYANQISEAKNKKLRGNT